MINVLSNFMNTTKPTRTFKSKQNAIRARCTQKSIVKNNFVMMLSR